MSPLRTERDVAESLAGKAVTLAELYDACDAAGVTDRDDGHTVIHGRHDTRWKRRARNALQGLRRAGRAERVGERTWVIHGERERPRWAVLVLPGLGAVAGLALDDACDLLSGLDDVDLVLADPPYGLGRGRSDASYRRTCARDHDRVVGGYVDIDPDHYATFMHAWVAKAASALRPGGQLVVVTATEQAWRAGHAAHDAGLGFVTQIAAAKTFPLRLTRRPAFAHWVVNVYAQGGFEHPQRVFRCPPELPKARSGRDYPLDVWRIGKAERRGLLRYDNALPPELASLLVRAFTLGPDNGGEAYQHLVVDPFVGSGTTALMALAHQRRFVGGDMNVEALRFTMARLVEEPVTLAG
jgi:DNA modification methylase